MPTTDHRNHWRARPFVAAVLRAAIFLFPIVLSLGATAAAVRLLPSPQTGGGRIAWFAVLLAFGCGVAVAVEPVARRALPLVTLLRLAMLFPDRAPSRFAVAREAGNVRQLARRIAELENEPEGQTERRSAATILALTIALQGHDPRTRGHAERVRVYTDMLAEEMHLPDGDRYRLRWAALLHDIGKLKVRTSILNKPGKLDRDEWEIIRAHPERGARIAAPLMEWLGPWGDAIAHHHERFDGSGYPGGLAGDQISVAGRIVTVADAYDTMTAARSYKKPMATRAAREELATCAGTQFAPDVVRAFFQISLPRLLWKTGPASFLIQLPFLAWIRQVGEQSITVAAQAATTVAVVATVTTAAVGGAATTASGAAGTGNARPITSSVAPTGAEQSAQHSGSPSLDKRRGRRSPGSKHSPGRGPDPSPSTDPGSSGGSDPLAPVTQTVDQVRDTVNQVTQVVPVPLPSIPPLPPL